jgi:cytochrome c oxidase subunit 2
MPIAVEVVPAAQFAAWVGSKGGHLKGAAQPAAAAAQPQTTVGTSGLSTAPPATPGTQTSNGQAPAPNNPNVANRANQ